MQDKSGTTAPGWQDWFSLIIGVWLLASPWVLGFTGIGAAFWMAIVLGAAIAIMAVLALIDFHEWEEWVDMVAGVLLIISPWVLGFAGMTTAPGASAATWNFVVMGLLALGFAIWSLMAHRGGVHA